MRDYLKKVIATRKRLPALRSGGYRHLAAEDHGASLAFARLHAEENVLVALNSGLTPNRLSVPVADLGWEDGRTVRSLLDHGEYTVSGGVLALDLPPRSGLWIG